MATTPIIKISQLPQETERSMSGNPANTWFAIVNSDVMKTKRISLETILKYLSEYFDEPAILTYFNISVSGGLRANNAATANVKLGDTITFSDVITFTQANLASNIANASFRQANASFTRANNALFHANLAFNHANASFNKANTGINLFSSGGLSFVSNNSDNEKLFLGQNLTVSASPFSVTSSGGITLDGGLSKSLSLGNSLNVGANPITINTTNGITGGKVLSLGESITLDASLVYNHSNSAYNYANNCLINPAINFVTANTTLYANNRYIVLGDKLGFTVQSDPKTNTYIYITNASSSVNNIIKFTGSRIHGLSEDIILNVMNVSVTLCYVGSTTGWVIV